MLSERFTPKVYVIYEQTTYTEDDVHEEFFLVEKIIVRNMGKLQLYEEV